MTDTKDLVNVDSVTFNMPTVTKDVINKNAVAKVNEFLPELDNKTKYFDRKNSQVYYEEVIALFDMKIFSSCFLSFVS